MSHQDAESRSGSPILARAGSPSPSTVTPPPMADAVADISSDLSTASPATKKRPATTQEPAGATKVTKRRAARACVSCRARKVRCDVVEGAPCGNCRWDNVTCVVQESRRRKKNLFATPSFVGHASGPTEVSKESPSSVHSTASPLPISSAERRPRSDSCLTGLSDVGLGVANDGHVPHMIYQRTTESHVNRLSPWASSAVAANRTLSTGLLGGLRTAHFLSSLEEPDLLAQLPLFIKPLPSKIAREDVQYLHTKGALTLPSLELQSALLEAYVDFVHPYMPLLELHDFLNIIHHSDGLAGQTSLLLYQAVMFAATAFVDLNHLREAGYPTRKLARKAFFQKTRLLYDFDYEQDRLVLVQALLLMTYWYETPDDQKDTWHWMGVAISLAHTIGLHRNPASTSMIPRRQRLWKRVWWSCFMRDRLIALGMRRPTRIKDEDYDVPMLDESDFEIDPLDSENTVLSATCIMIRDVDMQRQLAQMCIEKAKLCVCISHMLRVQYSVLNRDNIRPENTTNSTMMLFPNKTLDNVDNVNMVDLELANWLAQLPSTCQYRSLTPADGKSGASTLSIQRNLLHMVYQTTVSALHRPQFLPASPLHAPTASRQVQEMSRMRVRDAAAHITEMAAELHHLGLERYLPTTGVTVILPAMIIHLLDMKSPAADARTKATRGFRQCMRVMEKLREIYAAADFATGFLDAALRKAAIDANTLGEQQPSVAGKSLDGVLAPGLNLGFTMSQSQYEQLSTPPPENAPYLNATEVDLYHANRTYMPKDAHGHPAVIRGPSPPQTDKESDMTEGTTPSASVSVEERLAELLGQDDELDWNATLGSGNKLDFDQWLQFPAEGVNNTDELMGMFGKPEDAGVHDVNWLDASAQQPVADPASLLVSS